MNKAFSGPRRIPPSWVVPEGIPCVSKAQMVLDQSTEEFAIHFPFPYSTIGFFVTMILSGAKFVSNEFVLQQLQSLDGKLPESSLSDVLNGEFSLRHVINLLMNTNDNAGFDFDNIENHSLNDMVRTGTEDIHLDEFLFENRDQLLNTTDVVEGEKYENDVHVDQSPVEQKCQEMALYLNETYKGKALVEPYTVQPPTTASVHLGKAIRKRKKKAAKRLQSRKTRILFDADGDDDHDVMFISLEDWENTQSNKTRKRKDAIPLSEIAKANSLWLNIKRIYQDHLTVEEIRSNCQNLLIRLPP
ncbi:hypothetical protein Tco_0944247 [Tanacetum coccineum]